LDPQLDLRPRGNEDALPSFGAADRLSSRQTPEGAETVLDGSAELRRGGTRLRADEIRYHEGRGQVQAVGNVTVDQGGTRIAGPSVALLRDPGEGVVGARTYGGERTGARAHADGGEMRGKGRVGVADAPCSIGLADDEEWRIEGR